MSLICVIFACSHHNMTVEILRKVGVARRRFIWDLGLSANGDHCWSGREGGSVASMRKSVDVAD